jgi:hypothetical protein
MNEMEEVRAKLSIVPVLVHELVCTPVLVLVFGSLSQSAGRRSFPQSDRRIRRLGYPSAPLGPDQSPIHPVRPKPPQQFAKIIRTSVEVARFL